MGQRRTTRTHKRRRTKRAVHYAFAVFVVTVAVVVLAATALNLRLFFIGWPSSSSSSSFLLPAVDKAVVLLKNPERCVPPPLPSIQNSETTTTTNRTTSSDSSNTPPTGIVVTLLLGGENPQLKNGICSLFASQLAHFLVPHQLDVLLVVSGNLDETTIVNCLELKPWNTNANANAKLNRNSKANSNANATTWHNLDGSTTTTRDYQAMTVIAGKPYRTKVMMASEPSLRYPTYIQENPAIHLQEHPIQPPMCQAPVEYIQGTRWYTNEFLHLKLLQHYDYWIKMDPDIVFVKPLDFHILQDMTLRGAVFGHAAEYPVGVPTPCAEGISQAVHAFWHTHKDEVCAVPSVIPDADRYYSNVLIGRTDFFQTPGVLQWARWLSEYPEGFFRHRWTDQIFWHLALTFYLWDADRYIVDYTDLRCAPIRNCWMTSLELKKYAPLLLDVCENGGSFVHTKHALHWVHRWNRHLARKTPYDWKNQVPYPTKYHHDCRGTRWRGK
jgi:hypothetical protein